MIYIYNNNYIYLFIYLCNLIYCSVSKSKINVQYYKIYFMDSCIGVFHILYPKLKICICNVYIKIYTLYKIVQSIFY